MSEANEKNCSQPAPTKVKFVAGGNVQAKNGYYISREADSQLLELCRNGEYAFVLAPRQLGKSSLMNNTAECLYEKDEIESVIIDPSPRGNAQIDELVWYKNLMHEITGQLEIKFSFEEFKRKYGDLGATRMLELFFSDFVLKQVSKPVVIFIDEIDTTINLPFKDDFFASIRYFYQLRSRLPEFKRLTFVLIGVATPSDLISDTARTPFNLGERVDLRDFTLNDALPLAHGLGLSEENSREVLEWIMKWTNGHPYLTMSLCKAVADKKRESWTAEEIDDLVRAAFLGENIKENNLLFVRDMLTESLPGKIE